jgi:hypothetical protein
MNKEITMRLVMAILCITLLLSATLKAEETPGSKDFSISKIILSSPDDPYCKPCLFFQAGTNCRINVLQNFSRELQGASKDVILYFYNSDHKELLKATRYDTYVWGPHVNDSFLCFLPNTLKSGVYEWRVIVRMGQKEYQKSLSFNVKNPRDSHPEADKEIKYIEKQETTNPLQP